MKRRRLVLLRIAALAGACAASCAPADRSDDGYGLTRVGIRIDEESRIQLTHGGKEKSPVPASVSVDGKERWGRLAISGVGSLDARKRSYRFDADGWSRKLSAQVQDPSFLRTMFGRRVFEAIGLPTPEVEPVSLYLNGRFQGLYLLIERVNEDFFRRRGIGVERLYKAKVWKAKFDETMVLDPEAGVEGKSGGFHPREIQRLAEWAQAEGTELAGIEPYLDTESAARLFGANLFLANWDGFVNNWYLLKERGNSRLKFIPWDWERAYDKGHLPGEAEHFLKLNHLLWKLVRYPGIRTGILDVLAEIHERKFPAEKVREIVEADARRIERAHRADPYLGGTGASLDHEKEVLLHHYAMWISGVPKSLGWAASASRVFPRFPD